MSKIYSNQTDENFIPVPAAGRLLSRSPAAVRNLVYRGDIPYYKRAGRLYFLKSELIKWIKEGQVVSLDDLKKNR